MSLLERMNLAWRAACAGRIISTLLTTDRRSMAVLAGLMAGPIAAQAALIDLGTYTRDTRSQLEWLDVTATQGLTFDQATTGRYAQEGWRAATSAEVRGLFSAELGTAPTFIVQRSFSEALNLARLLGVTFSSNNAEGAESVFDPLLGVQWVTTGYYRDGYRDAFGFEGWGLGQVAAYGAAGTLPGPPDQSSSWLANDRYVLPNQAHPYIGTFLVRSVPEPASVTLLWLSLFAMAGARLMKGHGFRIRPAQRIRTS